MEKILFVNVKCMLWVLCGLFLAGHALAIKPDRKYIWLPQNAGLIYKRLNVITPDGYRIETWFYPAQETPNPDTGQHEMLPYKVLDKAKRPTLVICNGDAGNMSYQQIWLASLYTARGFNVVTFDWRGFGQSDDFPMDEDYLCYAEMLWDYEAVVREVRQQPEVDRRRIVVMGWSTGAYMSMITAYTNRSIAGCIVSGTPSSFDEVIPLLLAGHPEGKTEENLCVPEEFPCEQMPALIAPEFTKPILLVVGEQDRRTPPWMAEKIYRALPEKTPKRLSIYEKAGHGGMESPYWVDTQRWMEETVAFMSAIE